MKTLHIDSLQRKCKVKFHKSNYVCWFTFGVDYNSFICTNPDGSTQVFRRTPLPQPILFKRLLRLFPSHDTPIFKVDKEAPPSSKEIPIGLSPALWNKSWLQKEGYSSVSSATFYSLLFSQYLLTPQVPPAIMNIQKRAYQAIARLPLNNAYYSLLITQKTIWHEGANTQIYLCNFDKNGQLIDRIKVGGNGASVDFSFNSSSTINSKAIVTQQYESGMMGIGAQKQTIRYQLLPSGKFKQISKQTKYISYDGEYLSADQSISFGFLVQAGGSFSSSNASYSFLGNYEVDKANTRNRFLLRHKTTGRTVVIQFRADKTGFTLIDGNKKRYVFKRKELF